jgi:hypothetical protein
MAAISQAMVFLLSMVATGTLNPSNVLRLKLR